MSLVLRPISILYALSFCQDIHRRLPNAPFKQSILWAIAVFECNQLKGVSIVGKPNARSYDDGSRLQVLRVAVKEHTPNACSMLYGASSRAAKAMGVLSLLTYIHDDESGVSLRAAGWVEDGTFTNGGSWSTPTRKRPLETANELGPKRRFWAPWSKDNRFPGPR